MKNCDNINTFCLLLTGKLKRKGHAMKPRKTERFEKLQKARDNRIQSGDFRNRKELFLWIKTNWDDFTVSEIKEIRQAIQCHAETNPDFNCAGIVAAARHQIYDNYLIEGQDATLEGFVDDVVIMWDLGLCDIEKVTTFFNEFRDWMTRLSNDDRRVVKTVLVEAGLYDRIWEL